MINIRRKSDKNLYEFRRCAHRVNGQGSRGKKRLTDVGSLRRGMGISGGIAGGGNRLSLEHGIRNPESGIGYFATFSDTLILRRGLRSLRPNKIASIQA